MPDPAPKKRKHPTKPSGGTRPTKKPQPRVRMANKNRKAFLAALKISASVTRAAQAAGVSRTRAYQWRDGSEEFAQAWDDAVDEAVDSLEQEAWRRARDGVDKPVTFQGQITDTYLEYSDPLLMFLLRGHRPRFKDKVELSGPDGGPLQTVTRIERVIVDPKGE